MHPVANEFCLKPGLTFLNHGSFGACPKAVIDYQSELRKKLESNPVRFMMTELPERLEVARKTLAQFVGTTTSRLAFVANATSGVNAVLRSLKFHPGDQILVTDHGYNACSNVAQFVSERWNAEVVTATIPLPVTSPDEIVDAILDRTTERTKICLVDHVTSPTGIVFPIKTIIEKLHAVGCEVLVDGAHAPGMFGLDLNALDADYYAGNCHKWLCAPKGCGFLVVADRHLDKIHPPVISHGRNASTASKSRYHLEFDWTGTTDPTAALCVPKAIETIGGLKPGGWPEVMQTNRALALSARNTINDAVAADPICPDAMLGSLASIAIGAQTAGERDPFELDPVQRELMDKFQIEVPVFTFDRYKLLRISAFVYNELTDYHTVASALST